MNIFYYIFEKFTGLQKWNMSLIILLSLILSFFYTNISSRISAEMMQSVLRDDLSSIYTNFLYFIAASVIFFITYYIYKILQNSLLMRLNQWVKEEIFDFILKINNENMSNVNFADFIIPITRISYSSTILLNDILTNLIPSLGFLFVIFAYFYWKNWKLGLLFLLSNVLIFVYLSIYWKEMFIYKQKQEQMVIDNEKYIMDNLNNIEKVIYRGEINTEMENFQQRTDECISFTLKMMNYITNHTFVMNSMVYLIIFACLYYSIHLHSKKQMDSVTFITFLTILIMYRDNISDTVQSIPSNMESMGRIDLISQEFNKMIGDVDIYKLLNSDSNYKPVELLFDTVVFENVSFKYAASEKPVFKNYNKDMVLNDKIIGIKGQSGNGKSSFVKLILRLYDCTEGTIYIDGTDIKTIDPLYIRSNITYVNQSSKLFDRKILENIYYGCKDTEKCEKYLKEVLTYQKIKELYRNVDMNDLAGPLGENLSGGQRQVANIISGLINPTKVLILDEPTNGLDPELKREILQILQNFRKYKKCIMIITHDRDVHYLFDETIEI